MVVAVSTRRAHLVADVASDAPEAVEAVLRARFGDDVRATPDGFHVDAWVDGEDPRDLNRDLLSALRREERRTRLRAEWSVDDVTYRFFDYALRATRPSST